MQPQTVPSPYKCRGQKKEREENIMNIDDILICIKMPKITVEDIKKVQEEVRKSPEIMRLDEEIRQLKEVEKLIKTVF